MIHVFVGLPGSGKSHHARRIVQSHDTVRLFDDIFKIKDIIKSARENDVTIICDPHLCDPDAREQLEKRLTMDSITWHFFENNIEKCWANIKNRNDGRIVTMNTLKYFSELYKIPEGEEVIEIYEAR
jgi:hypothetical protein